MIIHAILGPLMPFAYIGFSFVIIVGVGGLYILFKNGPKEDSGEDEKEKKPYNYQRKHFFMTRAENDFYQGLQKSVGSEYAVFAQVHLPTIIDEKIPGQDWRAARAHINRKSVDFVLCDKVYLNPKLAIELDDASHDREDRQVRDEEVERMLKQAALPLLRVRYGENIDTAELTRRIKEKLTT